MLLQAGMLVSFHLISRDLFCLSLVGTLYLTLGSPALLVTKWVYAIELETRQGHNGTVSEREAQTMQGIRELLADLDDDPDENDHNHDQASGCLAARLARHWAGFYDDTWVWGVTPRMGWALRELANCYENSLSGDK